MCRVLNVARAGFYAWLHNPVSARDKDNQRLLMLIRDSYSLSGGVYGYRRVHGDLNEIGETCGRNRVGRIMQLDRIKAVRGYKAPRRIAGRPSVVAPNRVQRQFTVVRATRSGSPILLIVCPEFRASMEAQMNHESVWNIEPVAHDE
ncbi:hypothetical protein TUM12129_50930 (plasmid) [Klebsiella pneumoniae]|nr:hypothetical protein TUM12129_50930 [Klebsiella pneumoniae]